MQYHLRPEHHYLPSLAAYGRSRGRGNVAAAVPDSISVGLVYPPIDNQRRTLRPRNVPGKGYVFIDPGDDTLPQHQYTANWTMPYENGRGGTTISFGLHWAGTNPGHIMYFADTSGDNPQGIEAFVLLDEDDSQYYLFFNIFITSDSSTNIRVSEPLVADTDYHFTARFQLESEDLGESTVIGRFRLYRDGVRVAGNYGNRSEALIDFAAPGIFYIGNDNTGSSWIGDSPIYDLKMYYRPLSENEVWQNYNYDFIKANRFLPIMALGVEDSDDRVASGGAVCAGHAIDAVISNNNVYNEVGSGGARCAGTATLLCVHRVTATGGAVCAGSANILCVHRITALGGAVCAGSARVQASGETVVGSGGAVCAGSAIVRAIRRITATGGSVCAGSAVMSSVKRIIASGGARCAGAAVRTVHCFVIASGGAKAGGSINHVETEFSTGGISMGGSILLKRGTVSGKRQSDCFDAKVCKLRIQQIGSLQRRAYLTDQCRRPFRLWDGYVPGAASCPGEQQFTRILKVQTAIGYKNPREKGKLPNSNFGDVRK